MENIFSERLWRRPKYEEVHLNAYATVAEAKAGIGAWLSFYNEERWHQSLGYRTPRQIYQEGLRVCRRSALPTGSASPLPEPARQAGKCSPSPTSTAAKKGFGIDE
jgi:putative transposase